MSYKCFFLLCVAITGFISVFVALVLMILDGGIYFTVTPEHKANGGALIIIAAGTLVAHAVMYFRIKPHR